MSAEALKKAHAVRGLKPSCKQLLIHLSWLHKIGTPLIQTYPQLAASLRLSTRTICRLLDQLEREGHLRRSRARAAGKAHLKEFHLIFAEPENVRNPRQKAAPKCQGNLRQNGAPLSIGVNNPSYSPQTEVTVNVRTEPDLFRACYEVLGESDWRTRASKSPVATFLPSVVEKARARLLAANLRIAGEGAMVR